MSSPTQTREDGTQQFPFIARQGLLFELEVTGVRSDGGILDLSGRTGAGQMRRNIEDPTIAATFTVTLTQPTMGVAVVSLGADVTAALNVGDYVADVEFSLTISDVVGTSLFYVRVIREVTR